MAAGNKVTGAKSFVAAKLPWWAAAGGLLVYLPTLNWWVSFDNLEITARASGWLWQPEFNHPLNTTVFYPFRWLPQTWIPPALNLFTAICAALVLALLARSASLLPQVLGPELPMGIVRPRAILTVPGAWIPPVLAIPLCGLQLSFWEHATSASGEMLNLLLFAYVIRCLLEFHHDSQQSWLSRAAFLYGVGMANDWAMVACLPVFIAAMAMVKSPGAFLNWRFLFRMSLWGLAGMSLYLLLPALHEFNGHSTFIDSLRTHLSAQKQALNLFRRPAFRSLAIVSVVPLLALSIRWKSHFINWGDDNWLGVFLTRSTGHMVHGLFLVLALWIALDPTFSPRHVGPGTPMLGFYYLSALIAGYCAGYALLYGIGGATRWAARPARAILYVTVVALPLALAARNLGWIRTANGPALRQYARTLCEDLPAGKSVVLADDLGVLLRAQLASEGASKNVLLLETPMLGSARYHTLMSERYKERWPNLPALRPGESVRPARIVRLLTALQAREPLFSLSSGFEHFFERFSAEPKGLIYSLRPRAAHDFAPRSLAEDPIAANERLWRERWTNSLASLAATPARPAHHGPAWARPILQTLRLEVEANPAATFVHGVYSKALNAWGVERQRGGDWKVSADWFQRAVELNPENLSARINLDFNQRWQRGDKSRATADALQRQFPGLLNKPGFWRTALREDGRADEPAFLFRTGRLLLAASFPQQAAAELTRCAELAQDWPPPKLQLAQCFIQLREYEKALELTSAIEDSALPKEGQGLAQLLSIRSSALLAMERTNDAKAGIENFISQHGKHREVLLAAADFWGMTGRFENQLAALNELLSRETASADTLTRKGAALLQLSDYPQAIHVLNEALSLGPSSDEARLTRAIAYLGAGQLDPAREDYERLLKRNKTAPDALFGLATIAWRKHDTNSAVRYYQQFLRVSIPNSTQGQLATERLKLLTGK